MGDAGEQEGSANGTGKTLALNLVHHCLGAAKSTLLAESLPDWRFCLDFELADGSHAIERNGDGTDITLDGQATSIGGLQEWLNIHGPFETRPKMQGVSFRAFYRRFARASREDRTDPVRLSREKEQQSLGLTLYLLGTDVTLVQRKSELRERQTEIEDLSKLLRSRDARLQELLYSNVRPEARLRTLNAEIGGMRDRLKAMAIAEDYETIRVEADDLTATMRDLKERIALIDYRLAGIATSLELAS